jgi:hypothetical protein
VYIEEPKYHLPTETTMIVLLFEPRLASDAAIIADNIATAFHNNVEIELVEVTAGCHWPKRPSWDDLLVVIYDGNAFSSDGNAFIDDFMRGRGDHALMLPVAMDVNNRKPPLAAAQIKALPYDDLAKGTNGLLVKRVGGMLGLRVQGRDSKIFISYRERDGARIAEQIYLHLESLGHSPWRDQAVELDGDTKILPGTPVQAQIEKALNDASLVLLIDTPFAPESEWIRHEVDTADSMLIPVLPIVFRSSQDKKRGPRFRSLLALQRWVTIDGYDAANPPALSDAQLNAIVYELETYLCEIFRRKCRVPFIVEKEFLQYGFDWTIRDKPLFMYGSLKGGGRIRTSVITHCSIFDQIYKPSMNRFRKFINDSDKTNYSLFVYDGELLSEAELDELLDRQQGDVVVLHHQELSSLISSNFTNLGAA